ncbi:hypothetical protein Gotur_030959 [Gossypium turneri]
MRLWITAMAVGQALQRTVPMTRTVNSFSSSYLAKCTISSLLENSYSIDLFFLCCGNEKNCEKRKKTKKRENKGGKQSRGSNNDNIYGSGKATIDSSDCRVFVPDALDIESVMV